MTADGAYGTLKCQAAIASRSAKAVIPAQKTPNCGSPKALELLLGTKPSKHPNIWATLCGDDGADFTVGATLRLKHIV